MCKHCEAKQMQGQGCSVLPFAALAALPCPALLLWDGWAGLLAAAGAALACVAPGELLRDPLDGLHQEDQLLREGLDELLDELLRELLDELLLRELLDELLEELRLDEPVSCLALRSKGWCASPWSVSSR